MNQTTVLAQSRTVVVERLSLEDGQEVVLKTYSFPTWRDQGRGVLRGTLLGRNKAHREYAGLKYLERASIPVVEALQWNCKRNCLGFVTTCSLTTRAYSGEDLAQILKRGAGLSQEHWTALGQSVRKMHQAGFWHRGLSARNVLIASEGPGIAWLDTTKSKTYPPGGMADEKRAMDLLRFWTPLQSHTTAENQAAFEEGYGEGIHLERWWSHISNWKRASFRRELQREEDRFTARS